MFGVCAESQGGLASVKQPLTAVTVNLTASNVSYEAGLYKLCYKPASQYASPAGAQYTEIAVRSRFSPSWSTAISGFSTYAIIAEPYSRIFVGGSFEAATMTVNTQPVTTLTRAGTKSAFVIAYNATSGSPVWAKKFGNSGSTDVRVIAAYGDRVYVAGTHDANIMLGDVWHNEDAAANANWQSDTWVVHLRASESLTTRICL